MMKAECIGDEIMIERVMFVNRNTAENTPGWANWSVVSITEPDSAFGEAKLLHGWYAIHRSRFDDVDPKRGSSEPYVLMNEQHAAEIVDFVHSVAPHSDGILVHCQGGISRSAAVAKWIAESFQLPFNNKYERYNKHVYRLLKEANQRRERRLLSGR